MGDGAKATPGRTPAGRTGARSKLDETQLLELVAAIYRTTLEPETWPDLLERIGALPRGGAAARPLLELTRRQLVAAWPYQAAPGVGQPIGAGEDLDAGMLAERLASLDPAARSLATQLLPHVQRATALYMQLQEKELHLQAAHQVMERLKLGVVLVDEQGLVRFTNPSATRILAEGDGLALEESELRALEPTEQRELAQLLAEATRTGAGLGNGAGGALAISRPSDRQPLQLLVAPLIRGEILPGLQRTVAVVFVSDPDVEPGGCAATVRRLYDLTPCEARVALGVVAGRGLKDVAKEIGVGLNTVRTHLQHVFQKTGTRRQAELVQLLLRGPLQLRLGPDATPGT